MKNLFSAFTGLFTTKSVSNPLITRAIFVSGLLLMALNYAQAQDYVETPVIWNNGDISINADADNSDTYGAISFKFNSQEYAKFQKQRFLSKKQIDINQNGGQGTLKVDDNGGFHLLQAKHYDPLKSRLIIGNDDISFFDRDDNELLKISSDVIEVNRHLDLTHRTLVLASNSSLSASSQGVKLRANNAFYVESAGNNQMHLKVDDNGTFAYLKDSWINSKLHVESDATIRFMKDNTDDNFIKLNRNSDGDNNALLVDLGSNSNHKFKVTNALGNALLQVQANNKVGIGTNSPTEALEVAGNIKASSFIADAAKFPDYVFENGYELMPLNELNDFIQTNKHLPGMPTEKEVVENGLDVKEVSVATVEKVEELFLYILQLENRIKELEARK